MFLRNLKRTLLLRLAAALQNISDDAARFRPPHFANEQRNLIMQFPRRIKGAERITVGDDVFLGPNTFLAANSEYPGPAMTNDIYKVTPEKFDPSIVIGNRVSATGALQLSAVCRICIEDDVMFASNVSITDALHGFENADTPYKYQPLFRSAPVTIGKGSWIGQNVVIMPGVAIGEQCIIGANSTVTRSIPSRTIAFGNPARAHKVWEEKTRQWQLVDEG